LCQGGSFLISPGDIAGKQKRNENRIIDLIRIYPGISRQTCAFKLSLSTYTAGRVINKLIDEGVIYEDTNCIENLSPGRPQKPLHVNKNYKYFAGIEFDAQKWRFVVLDFSGEIIYRKTREFHDIRSQEEFLAAMNETLRISIEECRDYQKIESFCVGAPGFVSRNLKSLTYYELLPFLREMPITNMVQCIKGKPVYITHSIFNLAFHDVYRTQQEKKQTIIHLVIRSGISICISSDGTPNTGAHYYAGEIGLTNIGNGVFLQDIAGEVAFKKLQKHIQYDIRNGDKNILNEIYSNDAIAKNVLYRAVQEIGRVLANIQALLDSDEIAVYCAFMKTDTRLFEDLGNTINHQLLEKGLSSVNVICIDNSEMIIAKSTAWFGMYYQYPKNKDDEDEKAKYIQEL
jgi:predicted NBD/HSP70 family sugar kinase